MIRQAPVISPAAGSILIAFILLVAILPYWYQCRMTSGTWAVDFWSIWLLGSVCWMQLARTRNLGNIFRHRIWLVTSALVLLSWAYNDTTDRHSGDAVLSFFCLSGVYFSLRQWADSNIWKWLATGIAASSLIQFVPGLSQSTGGNRLSVMARFHNSGYFASYLLAVVPLAFALAVEKKAGMMSRLFFLGVTLVGLYLLFATGARASWLGMLVIVLTAAGIACLGYVSKLTRIAWMVSGAALFLLLFIALFYWRPGSAFGRLTIYRTAIEIIKNHPVFGVGPNRFPAVYGIYQSRLFERNEFPPGYEMLATDSFEAFDLPLQLGVELGLGGMVVFGFWLFSVRDTLRRIGPGANSSLFRFTSGCTLAGLFAASLFSNTFHSTPVLLLTVFHLAVVGSPAEKTNRPFWGRLAGIMMALALTAFSIWRTGLQWRATRLWDQAVRLAGYGNYTASRPLYERAYRDLKSDGAFLFNFGAEACINGEYAKAIRLLERARIYAAAGPVYLYLGDAYAGAGRYTEAEAAYLRAIYMVPAKLYPRYQLVRLYRNWGRKMEAEKWTQQILSSGVKIRSETTDRILEDLRAHTRPKQ